MMIRNYPVTRISVNPQTMNQETLDVIGRRHTVQEDTSRRFHTGKRAVALTISIWTLIVGLPGEDKDEGGAYASRKSDGLHPDSLTVHSLALKREQRA